MTFAAELTPSSLQVSLDNLASASNEKECATALVAASALLQDAVLSGQAADSFNEALRSCPKRLTSQLVEVMERAVSFHLTVDGGTLGLWMVPVALSTDQEVPTVVDLEAGGMTPIKMSGNLLQQLNLSAIRNGGNGQGWTFIVPRLYAEEQIRNADLAELIRLPHQAREVVRGKREAVTFNPGDAVGVVEPGVNVFFMPFVAFTPEGRPFTVPQPSPRMTARMTQWVTDTLQPSLGVDFAVHVAPIPQPFAQALRMGTRLRTDIRLREAMTRISQGTGIEPNGLAALVAPYAMRQEDGSFMVGVSLVSRLTYNVVGTLAIPVESSEDGNEEVALATRILMDMGMECIQDVHQPIGTLACQHCGNFQFALPSLELVAAGQAAANPNHVH